MQNQFKANVNYLNDIQVKPLYKMKKGYLTYLAGINKQSPGSMTTL